LITNRIAFLFSKSTGVMALTIGRFFLIAVSLSKPKTFALLELCMDETSHPFPKIHVSAPYFSGKKGRFIYV
jgi:hypothetical protein